MSILKMFHSKAPLRFKLEEIKALFGEPFSYSIISLILAKNRIFTLILAKDVNLYDNFFI
mgnify:FL=1